MNCVTPVRRPAPLFVFWYFLLFPPSSSRSHAFCLLFLGGFPWSAWPTQILCCSWRDLMMALQFSCPPISMPCMVSLFFVHSAPSPLPDSTLQTLFNSLLKQSFQIYSFLTLFPHCFRLFFSLPNQIFVNSVPLLGFQVCALSSARPRPLPVLFFLQQPYQPCGFPQRSVTFIHRRCSRVYLFFLPPKTSFAHFFPLESR